MQTGSPVARISTPSSAEFFAEHGYLILDRLDFDPDAILRAVAGSLTGAARITDGWRRSEPVRALACHPVVCATLAELFDADMAPFQTLNFARGTEQPVHTDSMFFDTEPGGLMAGVWVALEDIDAENGPLEFYPGSHGLPRLSPPSKPTKGYRYDDALSPQLRENLFRAGLVPRQAHLKRGQALIWHANLAHGGARIIDDKRTRNSQVTHYFARGHRYVQPISFGMIQPTDIRTGKRHGSAPIKARVREAVKNALRWAPAGI